MAAHAASGGNPFDLLGMDSLVGMTAPVPSAPSAPPPPASLANNNANANAMPTATDNNNHDNQHNDLDPFDFGSGMGNVNHNHNNNNNTVTTNPTNNNATPTPTPSTTSSSSTSGKWPSMLDQQWNTGCNSRQPSRSYMIICAKQCNVPGGIETLMRRGAGNSGNSNSSNHGGASGPSSSQASRNEEMILQMQNNNGGGGSHSNSGRNAAYPDSMNMGGQQMNMNMANRSNGNPSLTNKARSLAGRFTKAAKGAVDLTTTHISLQAIKAAAHAANSKDPSKAVVDVLTASVYVSQPIHTNYPGSAKFEELSKTEPQKLLSSLVSMSGGEPTANLDEEEVVWALPVLLPPALSLGQPEDQGKVRHYV
jgi:hypothetical protein